MLFMRFFSCVAAAANRIYPGRLPALIMCVVYFGHAGE
jgi:hypothetical protein